MGFVLVCRATEDDRFIRFMGACRKLTEDIDKAYKYTHEDTAKMYLPQALDNDEYWVVEPIENFIWD
ncbi:MAG: hypothetical protein AAF378_05155 [Cyanobacteria bacterium P01_A01_bin.84]